MQERSEAREREVVVEKSEPRAWSRRLVFIPKEVPVGNGFTGFKTSDGDVYVRSGQTGVIRRVQPKVRGKAARKAERELRRVARSNRTVAS